MTFRKHLGFNFFARTSPGLEITIFRFLDFFQVFHDRTNPVFPRVDFMISETMQQPQQREGYVHAIDIVAFRSCAEVVMADRDTSAFIHT